MEKKVLYLNQKTIMDPRIRTILPTRFDWNLIDKRNEFDHGIPSWYPRVGHNFLPLDNIIGSCQEFSMPKYDQDFGLGFEEVTDRVCQFLLKNKFDRPWEVYWSGGIDSTLIVTALLKNLSSADRENITIYCNYYSIIEYPNFFLDCIQPYFRTKDSTRMSFDNKSYMINGELGDQIFSHRYTRFLYDNDLGNLDWKKNPDQLISLIQQFSDNKFACWLYEGMESNIRSCNIPILDYKDWFWWLSFNFAWISIMMRDHIIFKNSIPFLEYLDGTINWYRFDEYQQWSMNNNHTGLKEGKKARETKISSKKYINSVYPDDHYFKYKTKTDSSGRRSDKKPSEWVCLLDDFSVAKLPEDLQTLKQALPLHCKN